MIISTYTKYSSPPLILKKTWNIWGGEAGMGKNLCYEKQVKEPRNLAQEKKKWLNKVPLNSLLRRLIYKEACMEVVTDLSYRPVCVSYSQSCRDWELFIITKDCCVKSWASQHREHDHDLRTSGIEMHDVCSTNGNEETMAWYDGGSRS